MKKTVNYYYSDIISSTIEGNIEFDCESDQVNFDAELKRVLEDPAFMVLMKTWLDSHSALNEIWRQNGEFVPECVNNLPFEELLTLTENATGYIGFNGMEDNADECLVGFLINEYKRQMKEAHKRFIIA